MSSEKNSLKQIIKYRLENFSNKQDRYLHKLLGVDTQKKIIFYASDPSKEESQRYLTEKFLIDYFSRMKDFVFVMKTHTQDNGKVTNYAYLDSGNPSNVILIGDICFSNPKHSRWSMGAQVANKQKHEAWAVKLLILVIAVLDTICHQISFIHCSSLQIHQKF